MAKVHNIVDRHKGEALEILLYAKDPDGSVITAPESQTVTITVSDRPGGAPLTGMSFSASPQVSLLTALTGEWFIQLTKDDLAALTENSTYFYNIWSQRNTEPARIQAKGKVSLSASIEF